MVEIFPVLGKPATAVEPADGSLDNPALRQNDGIPWPDRNGARSRLAGQALRAPERPGTAAGIGGVGEQLLEKREPSEQGSQDHQPAIAILHIGRGHQRVQQQSHRIDEEMALLALDQLAGIEPMWIDADPPFSALFTLWLSMMQAVGLASRSACSRHLT